LESTEGGKFDLAIAKGLKRSEKYIMVADGEDALKVGDFLKERGYSKDILILSNLPNHILQSNAAAEKKKGSIRQQLKGF